MMPTNVIVQIPDNLRDYHSLLREFFEIMIYKLSKNAHKDTPTMETLPGIMDKLIDEVVEFEQQVWDNKHDPNSLMELADQANFAFLAFIVLRNEGVKYGGEDKASNLKVT